MSLGIKISRVGNRHGYEISADSKELPQLKKLQTEMDVFLDKLIEQRTLPAIKAKKKAQLERWAKQAAGKQPKPQAKQPKAQKEVFKL